MGEKLVLVVRLWLVGDDVGGFEAFERAAARVMGRYGGTIERAIRLRQGVGADGPFEVHLVSFPDARAWEAYRNDPETLRLAEWRREVIARTEIAEGFEVEVGQYSNSV